LRFQFKTRKLRSLYTDNQGAHKYPPAVVDAFFDDLVIVKAAADERDLYAAKSLHYERLKGKREGQRSICLDGQYRLILVVEEDEQGKVLHIIEIADYH